MVNYEVIKPTTVPIVHILNTYCEDVEMKFYNLVQRSCCYFSLSDQKFKAQMLLQTNLPSNLPPINKPSDAHWGIHRDRAKDKRG